MSINTPKRASFAFCLALAFGASSRASDGVEIIWGANRTPEWILPAAPSRIVLPRTKADPQAQALAALQAYAKEFRLRPEDGFAITEVATDDRAEEPGNFVVMTKAPGGTDGSRFGKAHHVWLQQTYRGLKVSGGEMVVAMDDDGVLSVHGSFYPDIIVEEADRLDRQALTERVAKQLGGQSENGRIVWLDADPQVRVDEARFAHRVRIANATYIGEEGMESDNLLVSTSDGAVVARLPKVMRAAQTINDWSLPYASTIARCLGAPAGNPLGLAADNYPPTRVLTNDPAYTVFLEVTSVTADFDFARYPWWTTLDPSKKIKGAWRNADLTDRFYRANFNWNSFDNRGATITSNVHYSRYMPAGDMAPASCSANNAFWWSAADPAAPDWFERQAYYLPSSDSLRGAYETDQNVVTHELTHGLTELTSNLEYAQESGATNEASSDIMAESAEWWAKRAYAFKGGIGVDWQYGTRYRSPGNNRNAYLFAAGRDDASRYFYNPSLDRYNLSRNEDGSSGVLMRNVSQTTYAARNGGASCAPTAGNDWCYVHTNSGILNHFFFLMSRGGQNPRADHDVDIGVAPYTYGIGIAKAMKIWYGAALGTGRYRITSRATVRTLRTATILEAQRLYGTKAEELCAPELLAVMHAWRNTGWSDQEDARREHADLCRGQENLVRNGTLENGVSWRSGITHVPDWTAMPDLALAPPHVGAWASFDVNPNAPDEMMSAFLGGSGQTGSNGISTQIAVPAGIRAARLEFWASRATIPGEPDAADDGDALTVEIGIPSTGTQVVRRTIRSNALRRGGDGRANLWQIALQPEQIAALQGSSAEIRFIYSENDGTPTKATIDAVSFIVGR